MADNFVGEIRLFALNFAPVGWATCQGQLLPISQNTALFSLLGTFYGGDGKSTFALPDLRGRAAIHQGQGPGLSQYVLGELGGVDTVALTTAEIPAHAHTLTATGTLKVRSGGGDSQTPSGNVPAAESEGVTATYSSVPPKVASMKTGGVTFSGTAKVSTAGSGAAHENRMPVLTMNYCIALQGIFPPRS